MTELSLSVTANVLVCLSFLQEQLVLLWRALLPQGDEEHAGVQAIRSWLADQLIGSRVLLLRPVVLDTELSQPLCSGERCLYPLNSAAEIVLGLIEDGVSRENAEESGISLEDRIGKEKASKLVHIDIGLGPLELQRLGASSA